MLTIVQQLQPGMLYFSDNHSLLRDKGAAALCVFISEFSEADNEMIRQNCKHRRGSWYGFYVLEMSGANPRCNTRQDKMVLWKTLRNSTQVIC